MTRKTDLTLKAWNYKKKKETYLHKISKVVVYISITLLKQPKIICLHTGMLQTLFSQSKLGTIQMNDCIKIKILHCIITLQLSLN